MGLGGVVRQLDGPVALVLEVFFDVNGGRLESAIAEGGLDLRDLVVAQLELGPNDDGWVTLMLPLVLDVAPPWVVGEFKVAAGADGIELLQGL